MTDQPTEAALPPLDELIIRAVTMCGHSIDSNRLVLHFDAKKPGHNALNQLHRRIVEAIDSDRAARALTQGEPPEGFEVVFVKGFGELMYWLDRCSDKGHLENCADLIEPYEAFDWRRPEAAAPSALVASPVETTDVWDSLYDTIRDVLLSHRLSYTVSADDETSGFPLVDSLTPKGDPSIARGKDEIDHICDAIYSDEAVRASLAAIPVAAKVQP